MVRYQRIFDKTPQASESYQYPLLQHCKIDERNLGNVDCSNLSMYFCDFFMSRLKGWNFSNCEIIGGGIDSCKVIETEFNNLSYYWTGFGDSTFDGCSFENIVFQGVGFSDTKFKNCTFENVNFNCDNLGGTCYFEDTYFENCSLKNTSIEIRENQDMGPIPEHSNLKKIELSW